MIVSCVHHKTEVIYQAKFDVPWRGTRPNHVVPLPRSPAVAVMLCGIEHGSDRSQEMVFELRIGRWLNVSLESAGIEDEAFRSGLARARGRRQVRLIVPSSGPLTRPRPLHRPRLNRRDFRG